MKLVELENGLTDLNQTDTLVKTNSKIITAV